MTRAMAFDRSPDMDQAGLSYAPSAPLPGTFFGPSLDISSEKLYDLASNTDLHLNLLQFRDFAYNEN